MLSKCLAKHKHITRNASVATAARDPWTACWLVMLLTRIFTAEAAMPRNLEQGAMDMLGVQGGFKQGTC